MSPYKAYCQVYGCLESNHNKERSFFRFPKDEIRCKQWIVAAGRSDFLDKDVEYLHANYRVCDLHFNKTDRLTKRLKSEAIPTQNLPQDFLTRSKSSQTEYAIPQRMSTHDNASQTTNSSVSESAQTTKDLTVNSPCKRKLLGRLKTECKRCKILDSQLECAAPALDQKECVSPQLKKILNVQKQLKHKRCSNKYDKSYKLFALSIFFASPLAYRVLANTLNLPSERALRRMKIDIGTKLHASVLLCLQSKLEKLDQSAKFCIISVDEISLKRNLFYQINKDKIVGFHEINGVQKKEPAKQAYTIFARGIFSNWKQPLAYCFLGKNKYYRELKLWLDDLISQMINIGFNVVAFVSDQGSNFLRLAHERNVSEENPYFYIGDQKIYSFFYVPHLVKNVRNNLLIHNLKFEDIDGNEMTAKWEDIKTFYEQDSKKAYRLAPKLTESHIKPNKFEKMKVMYATQIFSQTVAAGMSTYIEFERLDQAASGTVKLIDLMNNAFDVLNSSVVKDPNENKNAFAGTPKQSKVLDELEHFLSTVNVVNVNNKDVTNIIECFKGLKLTINSVRGLTKDLQSHGFRFLFTRRLNQDPLENFFGSIRQQGGNCREPTPIQFSRAFRKLFMSKLMHYSDRTNCSHDIDKLLLDIDGEYDRFKVHDDKDVDTEQATSSLAVETTDYRFELPEKNAFVYVCGYLLHKCANIHKCEKIMKYISSNDQFTDEYFFTSKKSFNQEKVLLINPPHTFVVYVQAMDEIFKHFFYEEDLDFVGNQILNALSDISLTDCCECFPNTYLKKLFIRFRMYNMLKINNRSFKDKSFRRQFFSVTNI